jgi:hypothetical protein
MRAESLALHSVAGFGRVTELAPRDFLSIWRVL